jgi:hypothetical protein
VDAVITMKITIQDEARNAGREAERAISLANEQKLTQVHADRVFKAHAEYNSMLKALSDELKAAHRDDLAETGEASFKAGVTQGREDAQHDCRHVVASMLQEIAEQPRYSHVRDILLHVAVPAIDATKTISDALEKTSDSAHVE